MKSYKQFVKESKTDKNKFKTFLNEEVSWSKILFGKTIKELLHDIYSEVNPVLKYKKMNKYHRELRAEVEKSEKELEEKKKIINELEKELEERKNRNK